MMLIAILKEITRQRKFWIALTAVTLAHATLVYFMPYTGQFGFGFAFFPLFLIDAYLSAKFIMFVCGVQDESQN
jgi:hypothetical protein